MENNPPKSTQIITWRLIPIIIFIALAATFLYRLYGEDPSYIPSVLTQKPIPTFKLDPLGDYTNFTSDNFIGDEPPKVLNFWASWCTGCREEHQQLAELQKLGIIVYGINHKDTDENATEFLNNYGNVYDAIGTNDNGRVAINFGVVALPETFIIDNKGIIRYKQIGAITQGEGLKKFLLHYEAAKKPLDTKQTQ